MRVSPVGLLYHDDPESLREIAYHTSGITHSHEFALERAAVQACAVALAVLADSQVIKHKEFLEALRMLTQPGPFQEKLKLIIEMLDGNPSKNDVVTLLGNGTEALQSVPTAIYSFLANPDFEKAVGYAVSLGGDADTIGAMTGAIAGAGFGIECIPTQWQNKVENRYHIEQLAIKLREVKENIKKV